MSNGLGVAVAATSLLVGLAADSFADPVRVPRLSEAALRSTVRAAEAGSSKAESAGSAVTLGLPGGLAAIAARATPPAPSPRRPAPWMPASALPSGVDAGKPLMERASHSADGLRRRVLTALLGPVGARIGFYVGKNLARGDASGVRGGGLKIEF